MISKEEAIKLYGKVPCVFSEYYKYTFKFIGFGKDGAEIIINIGGSGGNIYKFQFDSGLEVHMKDDFYPISCIEIYKNNEIIYQEYRD